MAPPAVESSQSLAADASMAMPVEGENVQPIRSREELMSAFEVFNNVSAQLAETYQEMEERVGSLNQELHQVAEQRLQELKEKERVSNRLESLLHLLPAGVVVLDSKGVVTSCNPAAEDFLGEPLLGEIWRDVIRRSFAPQVDDGHEISLKDGRRISMVTRSMQGEPGQLILLTDLTETRELQRRLDRHRRLSEMGRMMSSLAHQIRTPLSAAMLYAGHLCDSDLTQQQSQRFSEKILSRLNHLDQQVKDMLIFVKGDVKLTDTIAVGELIHQLEAAMEVSIESSHSRYNIANDCTHAMIQCNRDSMVGALMNLINNAIQSVGEGVDISIKVSTQDGENLQIMIADNGPGIEPDVLKNLQEPFFTTKSQGTGLGLTVVKAVAQAHHGDFKLSSRAGSGTTAVLTLPVFDGVSKTVILDQYANHDGVAQ
ncbi:sensor histidine kinase [Oceanicoccus sagamiensis]|uniref:histidine kinase n=1 Tax=Oceanicoccus sagamiensis TaxID=716816 RepID=A0A1X9N4H5_9GAMM|nr:ATP-binding protein [Oceanicoccus sagamiensis]ARN73048.1 PAS domain-containing sensor histidine kinase [Oceanicoccus sagamiensis]